MLFPLSLRVALATLLIGLSLIPPLAQAQSAPPPRDQKNSSFWDRIDHPAPDPMAPPLEWYRPLAPIAGAPGPFLPTAAPATQATLPAQALEEASQFAEATNATALIVIHKGVVQLERYYHGAQAESVFSSHSMAKVLNALVVGAAIAEGKIRSVDEPASRWLTEWRDGPRDQVSIRHLLTMTSGFKTPPSSELGSHYIQMHYGSDVEEIVRDAPLANPPGKAFAFDNDNSHALSLVIERATGVPYAEYVSRTIWKKLGASNAKVVLDREGGRAYAYCCILATPRDWARLGQMLLNKGKWQGSQILPAAWVDEMRSPAAANAHVGYQVFLGSAWLDPQVNRLLEAQKKTLTPSLAPDLYYASGAGGQQLAVIPSDELVILRVGKGSPAWRDQVLPNLLHQALHPERKADWSWLYDWRLTQKQMPPASVSPSTEIAYWPTERIHGRAGSPLPRRTQQCLNPASLDKALMELERTRTQSFMVWHNGAIEYERYWPGHETETRAATASMHKSVLGLLIGQAIEDKFIPGPDAPISRWVTEWAQDPRGKITLGELLTMSSGLEPVKFDPTPGSPSHRFQLDHDVRQLPLSLNLSSPPGSTFNYISGVSQLLGLILERATGSRYADYLSRRLWQPLGAADALVMLDQPSGMVRTSANLFARAEDWVRLGVLFADDGKMEGRQVVAPSWIRAMATPSKANPNYGLHLWRASPHAPKRHYNTATEAHVPAAQPFLAEDMVYFDGAGAQRVYSSPKERLVIVRIGQPSFDWDDSRIPNEIVSALRACRAAGPSR